MLLEPRGNDPVWDGAAAESRLRRQSTVPLAPEPLERILGAGIVMKCLLPTMLALGSLAGSCTGAKVPVPASASPVPSVTVRLSKPQNV